MKVQISTSAKTLPTVSADKLLLAALSRVEDLVKGGTRTKSNAHAVRTYSGILDVDLISAVKAIMKSAVASKAVQLDSSTSPADDIPPIMEDAAPTTSQTQLAYVNSADAQILAVQLFKFGKAKTYGYIVSIRSL